MAEDKVILRLISNGECFAFLETKLDVKLDEIRKRIRDEASDLITEAFTFLFKKVAIGKKQESRLTVRQCSQIDLVKSKTVYNLTFSKQKEECSTKPMKQNSQTANTTVVTVEEKPESPPSNETCSNNSSVHKPRSINIDLYTDADIESKTCWLEKEKMIFWNSKVKELQCSNETLHFKKQELIGVLETSWVFKKAELLKIRISELEVRKNRYKNVFSEQYFSSVQLKSTNFINLSPQVSKSEEEISKLTYYIDQEHRKILGMNLEGKTKKTRELSEAEDQIHEYLHQLKRSSDSLYKALSVYQKRLDSFEAEQINRGKDNDLSPYLDTCEVEEIVSDILETER